MRERGRERPAGNFAQGGESAPHQRKQLKNPDRLPPHSVAAEAGLLGCLLLSPTECLSECQEAGLTVEWFYDLRHQLVWNAVEGMGKEGKGIDVVLVMERLKAQGLLEQVGFGYLAELPDRTPSSGAVGGYVAELKEKYVLRMMVRVGTNLANAALEAEPNGAEGLLGEAEKGVLGLRTIGEESQESTIQEILRELVLPELEAYHRGCPQVKGLGTGIEYFDKLVGGIGGEEDYFWVFGARPRTGKTSLALDFASYVAVSTLERAGLPVGVFSMEMTKKALGKRLLFQRAGADLQRWRTGFATHADFPPLVRAAGELGKAQIIVDDTSRMTIEGLKAKARRWHRQHGIRLFIIDYLQLMRVGGKRFREDRVQELAEVSGEIQALGKELEVPFVVLAQLNRDFEKEPNRAPRLSDLKDCGAIEQDADGVAFLYRPKLKDAAEEFYDELMQKEFGSLNRDKGEVEVDWSRCPVRINLLVDKNRFGPGGICELLFHRASTHFEDWNEWLKKKGYKARAAGESYPDGAKGERGDGQAGNGGKIADEDVPPSDFFDK